VNAQLFELAPFPEGHIQCRKCRAIKPPEDFQPSHRSSTAKWPMCRDCANEITRRSKAKARANGNYRRSYQRRSERLRGDALRRSYGIGLAAEQRGVCAICGGYETTMDPRAGRTRLLAVDHDHVTGTVRALLCHRCNQGLGAFLDDPSIIRKAAAYLEHFAIGVESEVPHVELSGVQTP
jgi:hypothetical protein